MNKGDRFTVVVLGYIMKLPDPGFRPPTHSLTRQPVNLLTSLYM